MTAWRVFWLVLATAWLVLRIAGGDNSTLTNSLICVAIAWIGPGA